MSSGPAGDVERVLAEVDGLAHRPLAEHVAVYADAHERLRRALDPGSGDPRPSVAPGPVPGVAAPRPGPA